ncbi:amino acid ABC transporter permease [Paenibacillus hodogayensis]|uniref:Amino acid ABC transporter permease n=1 Tax=Paenibacillus hodogayensis TaxID=279208 RepID=A0ABV5W6N3_9BACL
MGAAFDIAYVFRFVPMLLTTLDVTLRIVAGATLLGLIAGLLVALPRLYRVPVLQNISQAYVSFFRGTPILIQLFLFYYGLPELLKFAHIDVTRAPVLLFVIATYGLNGGAYMSEMIRSAVLAVDRGQAEAAYAIGMSGYRTFTRIVLPQALPVALPLFANAVIAMLKDTSLAFTLGVMELTGKSQTLGMLTRHFTETYLSLALIYLLISLALEKLFRQAERRLLRHEREPSADVPRRSRRMRLLLRRPAGKGDVSL